MTVPANEVVVVPADRVVDECPPESQRMRAGKVEYVPMAAWQSPDAAKRAEAFIAENPSSIRSSGAPLPALTMHQPIPETRIYRLGRSGWRY
jgi:hypothetical protein